MQEPQETTGLAKLAERWRDLSPAKRLIFAGWLLGLIVLGAALFFEKSSLERDGDPLALVASSQGKVEFRDATELLWRSTRNNQKLFENDSIATGKAATVRVAFIGGRLLELGPNTQIKLTRTLNANEETFTVDLLQGEVKALPVSQTVRQRIAQKLGTKISPQKNTTEVKIATLGQTFSLRQDSAAITLQKPKDAKEVKIVAAQKVEKIAPGDSSKREELNVKVPIALPAITKADLSKLANAAVAPTVEPAPKVAAPKPQALPTPPAAEPLSLAAKTPPPSPKIAEAEVKKKLLESNSPDRLLPKLAFAGDGNILWTKQPLDVVASKPFSVSIQPPSSAPKGVDWIPVVGGSSKIYKGKNSFTAQKFTVIPLNLGARKVKSSDDFSELLFPISAGIILEAKGKALANAKFGPAKNVRFRSLAGLSGPTILQVNTLAEKDWSAPFMASADKAAISLFLKDSKQFRTLDAFVSGSDGFAFKRGSLPLNGDGIFIVKDQQIIGTLKGPLDAAGPGLDALLRTLKADLIFKGRADTYIGGAEALQKRMEEAPIEKIYVAYESDFVGINRNFLNTNQEAKKFILDQSSSFFTEPIKILAPSEP